MRRFPLAPLLAASGYTQSQFSRRYGLTGSSLRAVVLNGFGVDAAERWAIVAGLHPMEVWSDHGLVECAAPDCVRLFAPSRKGHRFCLARCRSRTNSRDLYQTSPARRQASLAASAHYYATAGPYVRSRAAAYFQANRDTRLAQMRQRHLARTA